MAGDTSKGGNRGREKDYLKTQQQIKAVFDDQVNSVGDFLKIQETIGANWEDIRKTQKKIDALNKDAAEDYEGQKEELIKSLEQMKSMNKELARQSVSWRNLGKSIGSISQNIMGTLLDKYFAMDEAVRKTATSMGMASGAMKSMKASMMDVAVTTNQWGVGVEDLAAGQSAYSEALGRSVVLSEQATINMAETSRATGMAYGEMAGLAGEMEAFGLGANASVDTIWEISQIAEKMGVNQGKVLKKFQANLGLLNKLSFKGGMKGMAKMAAHSEKFKLSMEAVASVSDKVFRPEGAVEAAAQLQVLGGSLAQLGDPFQLMYQARNAPLELAKSITKAATASAVFSEKTGEFEVDALELDRLREAASALGMDYTELVKTAKESAKIKFFEKGLVGKGLDPKQLERLAVLATMNEGVASITVDGDPKALSALSGADLKAVLKERDDKDQTAKDAMSVRQQFEAAQAQFMQALMPAMEVLMEWIKGNTFDKFAKSITSLANFIKDWGKYIVFFVAGAAALNVGFNFFAKTVKIMQGVFQAASSVWGAIKSRVSKMAGGAGNSAVSQVTTSAQQKAAQMGPHQAPKTPLDTVNKGSDNMNKGGGKGKGKSSLERLAKGLTAMGTVQVLFGAANLIPTAIGMVAMLPALPTLLLLGKVKLGSLYKNLSAIGRGLTKMGDPSVTLGAANLILVGVGLVAITLGIVGFALVATLGWALGAGLSAIAVGLTSLGAAAPAAGVGVGILLAVGASMLMMGAAVALVGFGISMIVDSFTSLFSVVNMDNILPIMMMGPAFAMLGIGLVSLSAGLLTLGMTLMSPFGLVAVAALVGMGLALQGANFDNVASGITKVGAAVGAIDMDKLDGLSSAAMWLSLASMGDIDVNLSDLVVKGEVNVKGSGGSVGSGWVEDPIFIRYLGEKIFNSMESESKGQ